MLQARLQQYVNCEIPDVQAGFRKGRGTRDQIANIHWNIKKAREFQKNSYFYFIDYAKAFVWITINCGKFWKLIPACVSSSLAFHMMYSGYKLNKQGDNIQPWITPFPIWKHSVFPCPVLTVASWPGYPWWCGYLPRARHPGVWSQVSLRKQFYKQS